MTTTAMMSSKARPPNPRLAQVLFRSFLRASKRGHHPEVFGQYGAAVFSAQVAERQEDPSLALPNSASKVRQRLKDWFRSYNGTDDFMMTTTKNGSSPLQVLPNVLQKESLLLRKPTAQELPIFDYEDVAALPGEMTQFVLLEPRYLHMVSLVLEDDHKTGNDSTTAITSTTSGGHGQFLLRSSPGSSIATMVKIMSKLKLPNNSIAVACMGGPRVTISESIVHQVEGDLDPKLAEKYNIDLNECNQLAFATEYDWHADNNSSSSDSNEEDGDETPTSSVDRNSATRQYILDMLSVALKLQDSCLLSTLSQFGLPPLDNEAFSFWALRYVLAPEDVSSRLYWLNTTNTETRLQSIAQELEAILDQQYSDGDDEDEEEDVYSDYSAMTSNEEVDSDEDEEGQLVVAAK